MRNHYKTIVIKAADFTNPWHYKTIALKGPILTIPNHQITIAFKAPDLLQPCPYHNVCHVWSLLAWCLFIFNSCLFFISINFFYLLKLIAMANIIKHMKLIDFLFPMTNTICLRYSVWKGHYQFSPPISCVDLSAIHTMMKSTHSRMGVLIHLIIQSV